MAHAAPVLGTVGYPPGCGIYINRANEKPKQDTLLAFDGDTEALTITIDGKTQTIPLIEKKGNPQNPGDAYRRTYQNNTTTATLHLKMRGHCGTHTKADIPEACEYISFKGQLNLITASGTLSVPITASEGC